MSKTRTIKPEKILYAMQHNTGKPFLVDEKIWFHYRNGLFILPDGTQLLTIGTVTGEHKYFTPEKPDKTNRCEHGGSVNIYCSRCHPVTCIHGTRIGLYCDKCDRELA